MPKKMLTEKQKKTLDYQSREMQGKRTPWSGPEADAWKAKNRLQRQRAQKKLQGHRDALKGLDAPDLQENPEMEVGEEHPGLPEMEVREERKMPGGTAKRRKRKSGKLSVQSPGQPQKNIDYRSKYGDWLDE